MIRRVSSTTLAALLVTGGMAFGAAAVGNQATPGAQAPIQREVRHQLVTLSRYTVFDNIEYKVDGTEVTLYGQVTEPVLKDDATTSIRSIPGVTNVDNQIEVLPVSPMDWGIRRAEFRAIYSDASLNRYEIQAVPSIHIIVKNGHVTLTGAVSTQMDKNLAGIRANSVPDVFSVTNDLQVTNGI